MLNECHTKILQNCSNTENASLRALPHHLCTFLWLAKMRPVVNSCGITHIIDTVRLVYIFVGTSIDQCRSIFNSGRFNGQIQHFIRPCHAQTCR